MIDLRILLIIYITVYLSRDQHFVKHWLKISPRFWLSFDLSFASAYHLYRLVFNFDLICLYESPRVIYINFDLLSHTGMKMIPLIFVPDSRSSISCLILFWCNRPWRKNGFHHEITIRFVCARSKVSQYTNTVHAFLTYKVRKCIRCVCGE